MVERMSAPISAMNRAGVIADRRDFPSYQCPVNAEERDREGGPAVPRPQVQPAGRRFVRLDPEPDNGGAVRPFDGNGHVPPAWLGEVELRGAEGFGGRRFR